MEMKPAQILRSQCFGFFSFPVGNFAHSRNQYQNSLAKNWRTWKNSFVDDRSVHMYYIKNFACSQKVRISKFLRNGCDSEFQSILEIQLKTINFMVFKHHKFYIQCSEFHFEKHSRVKNSIKRYIWDKNLSTIIKQDQNIIFNPPNQSSYYFILKQYLKPIYLKVPITILINEMKYFDNGFKSSSKNRARYQDFSRCLFRGSFRISADDSMLEGGKHVNLYHPLHAKPIGYGVISDCGKNSFGRMLHGNALVNGPDEDLVVIVIFQEGTGFNKLDYPYWSGFKSTDSEEVHPMVFGNLQKVYYYPWDRIAMKILPRSDHSSIDSIQTCSSSQNSTGSRSIRNSSHYQSNEHHVRIKMMEPHRQHFKMLKKRWKGIIGPCITA